LDQVKKGTQPIESLSELVKIIFGLALSIGAISLISRLPATTFGILIDVSEFGFSFLILISVWLEYTSIMLVLPVEDSFTVVLNLVLLFLVSVEPYLFYLNIRFDLLSHELLLNSASTFYALDMSGLMLILALFTYQLAKEERGLVPKESMTKFKQARNVLFVSAVLFAITILPPFWTFKLLNLPMRFFFWLIPLILSSAARISQR
jgi:hypothetical protein